MVLGLYMFIIAGKLEAKMPVTLMKALLAIASILFT